MPTYLVHGFRWPREGFTGIRVHAVVNNLEDCSVEYIQNENSGRDILASFRKLYPDLMKEIEVGGQSLEFIEQYDPEDTTSAYAVSQPHAFVADKVVSMAGGNNVGAPLSLNVEEVITAGPGLTSRAWEAFAELRDKIASGETIGWWVVYNGDPERAYATDEELDEGDDVSTPTQQTTPEITAIPIRPKQQLQSQSHIEEQAAPLSQRPVEIPASSKPSHAEEVRSSIPTKGMTEPEASNPSKEPTSDSAKLREVAKASFRKKLFGRKA